MLLSEFDYDLPPERIAQTPASPRDSSRFMVLHRESGELEHLSFRDLLRFLHPGDLLVLNNSRVLPARVFGRKSTGGGVELLFLRRLGDGLWEALVRPGRRLPPGTEIQIGDDPGITLVLGERTDAGGRQVLFPPGVQDIHSLEQYGKMPLPPYIKTGIEDQERYQTVYSREQGSAAAPTAGLHFTPELLSELEDRGVERAEVTLHVGLDTFRPIQSETIEDHAIHSEVCEITPAAAEKINGRKGRLFAVGTTTVRTLESFAEEDGRVNAGVRETRLYITPGYRFRAVDAMVTNFHLPKSSLLVMISAFAGREAILNAYHEAIEREYRFYSFGDAMLIL